MEVFLFFVERKYNINYININTKFVEYYYVS